MPLGTTTKRYETPNHPFQGQRIDEEHGLVAQYGLKNKEELWRAQSRLRGFRREARSLLGQVQSEEVRAEREEFLDRLRRVGILDEEDLIAFDGTSPLADDLHPERAEGR